MKKVFLFVSAILLTAASSLFAMEKGSFGANGSWIFDDDYGTLHISGNEAIPDYPTPWDLFEGITNVVISEGITGIGSNSFYHCGNSIQTYDIPASVTSIDQNAFWGNNNVTTITVHWRENIPNIARVHNEYGEDFIMGIFAYGSGRNFDDITLSVPYRAAYIYRYRDGWKDFNIVERPYALNYTIENGTLTITPAGVSNDGYIIGSALDPWDSRFDFSQVIIGSGITSIPLMSFYHCGEYIKTIDIPATVETISEGALLAGGNNYEKIIVHWTDGIPAITTAHIGLSGNVSGIELSVPKGTGDLYAALTGWQDFNIVEREGDDPDVPDGINDVSAGKTVASETCFSLTGTPVSADTQGILIKKTVYTDGTVKTIKIIQ